MKLRSLCSALALLTVMAAASTSSAQDYTLNDALSGQTIPLLYKPANLPADFKAVKIIETGSAQATPIPSGIGGPADMFIEMLPVSWTNGQIIGIAGQPFLVTYGIELGPNTLKMMSNSKKIQPFSLRLKLIKTTEITAITPLPEWTKTKYMRAMAQVVVETPMRYAQNTPPIPDTRPTTMPEPVAINEPQPTTTPITTPPTTTPEPVSTNPKTPVTAVKDAAAERPIDAALYQQAEANAKTISAAMLVYAQDYDGTFPYVQSSRGAAYVLYPYVKGTNVYETLNPVRGGEFRFNMCLAGVKMADITDPSNTPLFYDPFAWPNSSYLVAFADSHVKFLTPDQWEMVKKNLALKLTRNGKPLPADLGLPSGAGTTPTPAPSQAGTTSPPTPSGNGN